MKKLLLCVLLVCSSILAGCSATSTKKQTIAFDDYRISLPAEYREVSSSLIENKQILNKVLKSYKKDEDRQFATNLVITKSVIAPELDYEQFWTANTNKLKSFLVGYQAGDKQLISFDCGETSIKGIYVSFSIENSFLGKGGPYQFSQYQFTNDNAGYIISLATAVAEEQADLLSYIETLSCF